MSWERDLLELFDDLEGQAEDLLGRERDQEVAEQARAEYASVPLLARLMASGGREVDLQVRGVGQVAGRLARCARSWCLVERAGQEWVVRLAAVLGARGLSDRALPEEAWPLGARVGIGSALRRLADQEGMTTVLLDDGSRWEGTWGRLGKDFAELRLPTGSSPLLVAHSAVAALTHRVGAW